VISRVVAGRASPIAQALEAVVVGTATADHLPVVLVVSAGTNIVAQILADHVVGSAAGVALLELEG
jgi:hypothetical protein